METIARFQNAGISLGGQPVLRGVDLSIGGGESVGVTGPNGSGKTTLVRAAATLLSLDEGTLTVLGSQVTGSQQLSMVRRRIGLVGHQPSLIPQLSLTENLEHVARLAGVDTSRVRRALDVVGLGDAAGRRAETCSFGMQRRVEIAHLLMTRPSLLLLDEAAAGLDEAARELVDALVSSVCRRGGGCLIVSHDRAQLSELTSRVLTLSGGRLEAAT